MSFTRRDALKGAVAAGAAAVPFTATHAAPQAGGPPRLALPYRLATAGDIGAATVTARDTTAARSLAGRFAELFNVRDHGAAGDGVTDDAGKVRAADSAAGKARGAVVIPTGRDGYVIDAQLLLSDWVSLLGRGLGSFMKFTNAASRGDLRLAGNHFIDALRMEFAGRQGLFAGTGAKDVRITRCTFEGNTIHMQINAAGVERWMALQNIFRNPGYGLLLNSRAVGRSVIWGDAIVEDATADAVEINDTNRSFPGIIVTRAHLDCKPGRKRGNAGFVIGIAGGHRIIAGDIVARQTRQEAVHIEDKTEALIVRDMILDECAEDGVHVLNRRFLKFDAGRDVDPASGRIAIRRHGLMTGQPVDYKIRRGAAIGSLAGNARYYAIVVDDDTIRLAATPGGPAIRLTGKSAGQTHRLQVHSRGFIFHDLWLRKKDEARTNRGFRLVQDRNGSAHDQIVGNIYARGFATGFSFGQSEGVLARNLIADNCATGVSLSGRNSRLSDIDGVLVRDCATGIRARGGAKIGHVTFRDVATPFEVRGAAGQGLTVKGHAGKVVWRHPGRTAAVAMFPAGANDRIKGTLQVHAMARRGSADNAMLIAGIRWDGARLTLADDVSRVTGVADAPTLRVNGGNLEFRLFSGSRRSYDVYWDFDGYYYKE